MKSSSEPGCGRWRRKPRSTRCCGTTLSRMLEDRAGAVRPSAACWSCRGPPGPDVGLPPGPATSCMGAESRTSVPTPRTVSPREMAAVVWRSWCVQNSSGSRRRTSSGSSRTARSDDWISMCRSMVEILRAPQSCVPGRSRPSRTRRSRHESGSPRAGPQLGNRVVPIPDGYPLPTRSLPQIPTQVGLEFGDLDGLHDHILGPSWP